MTIRDILTNIRERLQKAGIEDFEYESWVLLEWKLHIEMCIRDRCRKVFDRSHDLWWNC